ncbi:reverse transcriptase domain-containing protein [Tanacetum coccineum]
MIFYIDSMMKHSYQNDDTCFSIDVIDEILEEDFDALFDEEPPTDLELKPLPDNLEYVSLEEPSFLPVIISSQLSKENKNKLVSEAGLEVDKAKIDIISKLLPPTNIKGIRSFLGHAGFYRRFIKDFSKIACPLTKFLEKDTPFEFNDECLNTFKILKEKLTYAPVIVSPNWSLPFELMCDASDFAVIAILEFDIEIKDRKGTKNVVADHLSRIENEETSDNSEVDDNFPGETLMEINTKDEPWYYSSNLENYEVCSKIAFMQATILYAPGSSLEVIPSSKEINFKCFRLMESKLEEKKNLKAEKGINQLIEARKVNYDVAKSAKEAVEKHSLEKVDEVDAVEFADFLIVEEDIPDTRLDYRSYKESTKDMINVNVDDDTNDDHHTDDALIRLKK